jgi:hypothetical protein
VSQEGPVTLDLIFDRVKAAHRLKSIRASTRGKIAAAAGRLVDKGVLQNGDERSIDIPGRPIATRDRSQSDDRVRSVHYLPPVELRAAIREELARAGETSRDALLVGSGYRLGLALKSGKSRTALAGMFQVELDRLAGTGILVVEGDRVRLADAPATSAEPEADDVAAPESPAPRDSVDGSDPGTSTDARNLDASELGPVFVAAPPHPEVGVAGAHAS